MNLSQAFAAGVVVVAAGVAVVAAAAVDVIL